MRTCVKCRRENVTTTRGRAVCPDCREPNYRPVPEDKRQRKMGQRACVKCREQKAWPAEFQISRGGRPSQICNACGYSTRRVCERCGKKRRAGLEIKPKGRICTRCLREAEKRRQREYMHRKRQDPAYVEKARARWRDYASRNAEKMRARNRVENMTPERRKRDRENRRIRHRMVIEQNGGDLSSLRMVTALGGWKEASPGNHLGEQLDARPLADWLRYEFASWPIVDLARHLGVDDSHLYRILSDRHEQISLHIADRICVHADCTHMLALLYPEAA